MNAAVATDKKGRNKLLAGLTCFGLSDCGRPAPSGRYGADAAARARSRRRAGRAGGVRGTRLADLGAPIHRLEDLREEWQGAELELEDDARVVETEAGRIVAYAAVRRSGTLAVVAPVYEGRGIGARLLDWAEGRERALGHPLLASGWRDQRVRTGAAHPRRLLEGPQLLAPGPPARGGRCARAPAGGLALRSVEVERDGSRLHALDAASFAGAPDYSPESLSSSARSTCRHTTSTPG